MKVIVDKDMNRTALKIGSRKIAPNFVTPALVVEMVALVGREAMQNVESPKCHKAVLSMVLKPKKELGHGSFLSKLQADSISAVEPS